jgi:DNA-binding transcriptional LysR family regulator
MQSLDPFRLCLAVSDAGSFTAVAEREGVHPSSISRRIDALEAEVGTQLFFRTTRKVALTRAGEVYLARLRELLASFEAANLQAREATRVLRGRLRISVPLSFGRLYIAPLLAKFCGLHAEIELSVVATNQLSDLVAEGIDLAIRVGASRDLGLISRTLGVTRPVACASPGYLERRGSPANPKQLRDHACLLPDYGRRGSRWYFTRHGRTAAVDVSGPLKANTSEILVAAARQDLGIALVARALIIEELRTGVLRPVLDGYTAAVHPTEQMKVRAVFVARKALSEQARVLIDFLYDELRALRQ